MWHSLSNIVTSSLALALRQPRILALLRVLAGGLKHAYTAYQAAVERINRITRYTGQVAYLQRALQDSFGQGIWLAEPAERHHQVFIFNLIDEVENEHFFNSSDTAHPLFAEVYLFNSIDYVLQSDFLVMIAPPIQPSNQLRADINALVLRHAPVGRRWAIVETGY